MSGILSGAVALLDTSKYFLFFIGSFFEGSVVMLTAGFFLQLKTVTFWPTYFSLFAGDVLADLAWYAFGYFGARPLALRFGRWIDLTEEALHRLEELFHTHHTRLLIISKLTMGFGFAPGILTVAGIVRIPFWRYFLINFFGGIVWVAFLVWVGYYFGNLYNLIPRSLQIGFIALWIIAVFFLIRYLSRYLKRKLFSTTGPFTKSQTH